MAAAYAALVSLMHIIYQIEHHPRPPIFLHKSQVESLTEKVTFLKDFLEGYNSRGGNSQEADDLESRIADAAYAAEDVIESHIVDQILSRSTTHGEKISSVDFYEGLQKVIEDMEFIKKEAMEIKEKMEVEDQQHRSSSVTDGSLRSSSLGQSSTMVGSDDVLLDVMDKLTGGQLNRQIIPIIGMGGIGKTTLARVIYQNQVVVQHFDILAWVTISQEYKMRDIILELLKECGENFDKMNECELGEKLYKSLSGRRYLIIIDDIWNVEVWDQLKFFFPENNDGSRIMLTTRLSKLAFEVANFHGIQMGFLDEDNSWKLFCKNVFGEDDCPPEIKEIGKDIVENCKGLPLSIIVIGGLLAKSERTQQYWEHVAKNLNSIVNLEDNEHCLQVLYTSYNSLPVHLKPCFLYTGAFQEDRKIHVFILIILWVAEGFLKPIDGKSLEEVAEEYLKELIDRNLILVHERDRFGKILSCNIHDLLRDLCLREAQKQKFLYNLTGHSHNIPQGVNNERRICIRKSTPKEYRPQVLHALESASLARSLIYEFQEQLPSSSFRLLRVSTDNRKFYLEEETKPLEAILQQVNLRCIAVRTNLESFRIPSSISLLWNLQTLIVESDSMNGEVEIWKMPLLRHVDISTLVLPDPPSGCTDDTVLENLHTLSYIKDFKCDEEVVKRIPNIKRLRIFYLALKERSRYCLNNICHLHKLESLDCTFNPREMRSHLVQNLTFPRSPKTLTLYGTKLHWEEMTTKIGSLPLLEVLQLHGGSCVGANWETVEEQFCSLKFLHIEYCDLEYWKTDSTHFPRLEHIVLRSLKMLKEIPSSIGDIPTLQSIKVRDCSNSALDSAKRIQEEQEELGNVGLQIRVRPSRSS